MISNVKDSTNQTSTLISRESAPYLKACSKFGMNELGWLATYISNSTAVDQIRLAVKRIAVVSHYEGRLYSARKRNVQAAPFEQDS